MSGFIGSLLEEQRDLQTNEWQSFNQMMNKMVHRGPDGNGFYADESVRLGFHDLQTLDGSQASQPLSLMDGRYWIVFDGVIHNHRKLHRKLKAEGYTFETSSQAEVLLTLFTDKNEQALKDIRGVFSMLIWDKEEKELFGARDVFGVKPFYIMEHKDSLYCASEMKCLYGCGENELDHKALQHYFSFQYVPEPRTTQKNIRKLEPGCYFRKKPGEALCIESFSKLEFRPVHMAMDKQVKNIRDALRESVHLHMQGDVSVGAFLSGGVDSSSVVALAKEIYPSIPTFTVGFEREAYSEITIAQETAKKLGVENIHYVIRPEEFMEELPKVIWHMDDPVADPASVPLYFAAREARKWVKVVLSGEGADELFGGYNIYREPGALKLFDYTPQTIQFMLRALANQLPEGIRGKSFIERGTTPLEERFIGNTKLFDESEKNTLLKYYQLAYHHERVTQPLYDHVPHYPDVHKMQYIDLHTWARGDILVKADRMSKAHGLELRSPFFDRDVFRVASTLLPEQTIANGTTKYVFRKAMQGIVPDSALYNKKLGFPVPIRHWLKNELDEWAKDVIKSSPTDHLINKKYVLDLLEIHQLGRVDYSREIWAVLVFMIWYGQYHNTLE